MSGVYLKVPHCEYSSTVSANLPCAALPCHTNWRFPGRHSKTLTHQRLECGQYCFTGERVPIHWQLRTHSGSGHTQRAWEVGETYASRVCRLPFGSIVPCPSLRERGWRGLARPLLAPRAAPRLLWLPAPLAWRGACPAPNLVTFYFPFLQAFLIWGFVCWTPCRMTGGLLRQTPSLGCYCVRMARTITHFRDIIL